MDGMPLRYFALFSVFLLSSCGPIASKKASIEGATGGNNTTTPTTDPTVGTTPTETAGFFVKLSNTDAVSYTHKADVSYGSDAGTTNWDTECRIDVGTAKSAADLFCITEMEELDLYFTKLKVQYHLPASMCSYVRLRPYYFYAFEPGTGPTTVSYEVYSDGTIVDHLNSVGGSPYCKYNYTGQYAGAPNCCIGNYSQTVVTYASDGSSSPEVSAGSWGGLQSACLSGPAMDTQEKTTNGFPRVTTTYIEGTGINTTYDITANRSSMISTRRIISNVRTANFYKPSEHTGGIPIGMQAPSAVSGSTATQDTYDFECLDRAGELNARIRLMIREWNTDTDVNGDDNFVEGGDPDLEGDEVNFPGMVSNDHYDWKDFGDNYPSSDL